MVKATFGMGCFWASQDVFDRAPGVTATEVGYANGQRDDVDEATVFSGAAGHAEVVVVTFDSEQTDYAALLEVFWSYHDATGEQRSIVRSTLVVHDDEQRKMAEASVGERRAAGAQTIVEPAGRCWKAPEDQQHYLAKQRMADAAE